MEPQGWAGGSGGRSGCRGGSHQDEDPSSWILGGNCYLVPLKPSQCPALSRYSMTLIKVGLKREVTWTLFIFKAKPLFYQYHEHIRATVLVNALLCVSWSHAE